MNDVFRPLLRRFVLVLFDDILVYSKLWQNHLQHLALSLDKPREHSLFAKMSECYFGQIKVEYLGHTINDQGVSAKPRSLKTLKGISRVDWIL